MLLGHDAFLNVVFLSACFLRRFGQTLVNLSLFLLADVRLTLFHGFAPLARLLVATNPLRLNPAICIPTLQCAFCNWELHWIANCNVGNCRVQIGKAAPRLLAPLIGGGYDEGVAGAGMSASVPAGPADRSGLRVWYPAFSLVILSCPNLL
jgi:hypothetical protein